MTGPLRSSLVPPPGLTELGDEAAGFCADGVCDVPEVAAAPPGEHSPGDPSSEPCPPTGG